MKSFYFRLTTNNNSTMMRSKQSLHTEVMRVRVRLRLAGVCPGLGQAGDFTEPGGASRRLPVTSQRWAEQWWGRGWRAPTSYQPQWQQEQSAETRDTNTEVSESVIFCLSSHHPKNTQKQGWSEDQWSGRNIYRESHQFLLHWPDRISSDNILQASDTVTSTRNQVNIPKIYLEPHF